MEPTYLAIAFGKNKEYGAIAPFEPGSEWEKNLFHNRMREGKVEILYDGVHINEARKAIAGRKNLGELIEKLFPV